MFVEVIDCLLRAKHSDSTIRTGLLAITADLATVICGLPPKDDIIA